MDKQGSDTEWDTDGMGEGREGDVSDSLRVYENSVFKCDSGLCIPGQQVGFLQVCIVNR